MRIINHICVVKLVLIALLSTGTQAQLASDYQDQAQTINGIVYEYAATAPAGRSKGVKEYGYELSAKNASGEKFFSYKLSQNPGCSGKTPAIQAVAISESTRYGLLFEPYGRKFIFIIFCGSDLGKNNTMWFYLPGYGMAYKLEFHDYDPVLHLLPWGIYAVVNRDIWLDSLGKNISYPIIYELKLDSHTMIAAPLMGSDRYQQLLEPEFNSPEPLAAEIRKIMIHALAGDTAGFCLQARQLNRPALLAELAQKTNIPSPACDPL